MRLCMCVTRKCMRVYLYRIELRSLSSNDCADQSLLWKFSKRLHFYLWNVRPSFDTKSNALSDDTIADETKEQNEK